MKKLGGIIDVDERNIVLATRNYGRNKPGFAIYLLVDGGDVWKCSGRRGLRSSYF
jgi:hypothetical protein